MTSTPLSIARNALIILALMLPALVTAQEKPEISVGADVVSAYISRGIDCGGVSLQPDLTMKYRNLLFKGWASMGFDRDDTTEIDLILGYDNGKFTAKLMDYWFLPRNKEERRGFTKFKAHDTIHLFEASVGYNFGPLYVEWDTNFAGIDTRKRHGKLDYSTFIDFIAPFSWSGLDWTAEVAVTPWKGMYHDSFNIATASIKACKTVRITDTFSLPVFSQIIYTPYGDNLFFVLGLRI